jgi:hypothetical protein
VFQFLAYDVVTKHMLGADRVFFDTLRPQADGRGPARQAAINPEQAAATSEHSGNARPAGVSSEPGHDRTSAPMRQVAAGKKTGPYGPVARRGKSSDAYLLTAALALSAASLVASAALTTISWHRPPWTPPWRPCQLPWSQSWHPCRPPWWLRLRRQPLRRPSWRLHRLSASLRWRVARLRLWRPRLSWRPRHKQQDRLPGRRKQRAGGFS